MVEASRAQGDFEAAAAACEGRFQRVVGEEAQGVYTSVDSSVGCFHVALGEALLDSQFEPLPSELSRDPDVQAMPCTTHVPPMCHPRTSDPGAQAMHERLSPNLA